MEFSKEMKQSIEEAGKDAEWTEKVRAAATWEEYEKLLAEKGIEAPAELKEKFETGKNRKCGELQDDELESVSGGWNIFPCEQREDVFLCEMTFCPHRLKEPFLRDYYCDLGYWDNRRIYDLLKDMKGM